MSVCIGNFISHAIKMSDKYIIDTIYSCACQKTSHVRLCQCLSCCVYSVPTTVLRGKDTGEPDTEQGTADEQRDTKGGEYTKWITVELHHCLNAARQFI